MNQQEQPNIYIPKSEMFAAQVHLLALIMQVRFESRQGKFSPPVAEEMQQHAHALMGFIDRYQC